MRDCLLHNDGTVKCSPHREENSLTVAKDHIQIRFKHVSNDLGDDILLSVAKTYRSEVLEIRGISTLRY